MKRILLFLLLLPFIAGAQSTSTEINTQVWKPWLEAYSTYNPEKFLSVYSKSIIRISRDEGKIFDYAAYRINIMREMAHNKNYKIKLKLDLRFHQRLVQGDLAFESGIYKMDIVENTGKPVIIYSRFEVVLKKENGIWKIITDTDGGGEPATEKQYQELKALE